MDNKFIGEHGIRLDLVATTSSNEILNIVLRKQIDTYYVTFITSEVTKMQKHCDSSSIKQ